VCAAVAFAGTSCTGYRLPTEAEWEYAARAGTATSTWNGTMDAGHLTYLPPNPYLDPIAWYGGNSFATYEGAGYVEGHDCGPQPVKGKLPNDWGLYDVLGNVAEWCWGDYARYPAGPATDPAGPGTIGKAVNRGGSWANWALRLRVALRTTRTPDHRLDWGGFRPARTLPP
jgi:formylglycine-generating enzyme required for sulfatase activity